MRIHLEGSNPITLTDWTISRGYVEFADCNDGSLRREPDGTVVITGRIAGDGITVPSPWSQRVAQQDH